MEASQKREDGMSLPDSGSFVAGPGVTRSGRWNGCSWLAAMLDRWYCLPRRARDPGRVPHPYRRVLVSIKHSLMVR